MDPKKRDFLHVLRDRAKLRCLPYGYQLFVSFLQVEHTFSNYGPGLRYIHFFHRGKDTQFWAGHYGCKMAGSQVGITMKIFRQ